jgi:hypothetical protein
MLSKEYIGTMSFCQNSSQALTDSDLNATYGTMEHPGLIPQEGFPADQRDTSGLLKQDTLQSFISSQEASGKIPRPPKVNESTPDQIETYMKKDRIFVDSLAKEYCFYDVRYKYALRQLIEKLQQGYTDSSQQNSQLIQTYLKSTQALNQKLNDLTQLANGIAQSRLKNTKQQSDGINYLNAELAKRSKKLNEQNKILSSEQATALLYKDMVKYTKERADSTNNLLSMYSFMNIIVLGMLIYLYRSMQD